MTSSETSLEGTPSTSARGMRQFAIRVVILLTAGGFAGWSGYVGYQSFWSSSPSASFPRQGPGVMPRAALSPSTPPTPIPVLTQGYLDDSGYDLACQMMAPIADRSNLIETRATVRDRGRRGIEILTDQLRRLPPANRPGADESRARLRMLIGALHLYQGEFVESDRAFAQALEQQSSLTPEMAANLLALRGVAALRKGEVENCIECLGPSSCIFPIDREAQHQKPEGSRAAIGFFQQYLDRRPDDLGAKWLLLVAHQTLAIPATEIPAAYRLPLEPFVSRGATARYANIASAAGLTSRGPNMLGGVAFDDFTNDGRPDLFVISGDCDLGASLFVNLGNGSFEDRGASWGLSDQTLAYNASHADFDNDGLLDVLALRGGWESPFRMSLLRNTGSAFADVTVQAGLDEPIASQSAAWGDYDLDGDLDVFVCGEFSTRSFDPRNYCRLYRNSGKGTFENVAESAGVQNERLAKGASWGDFDNDGDLDLYVSNMNDSNRLYRNEGDGKFVDVAETLGVTRPIGSFSCWFFDYDNDGWLDLFVAGFHAWLNDVIAHEIGEAHQGETLLLYRNEQGKGFRDVTAEVGLDRVLLPMGTNFADVDNDGWLDIYLGTGKPMYTHLTPNVLYRNLEGRRFEDVTTASGTGHLQKGHGVGFADFDDDGDLDLFVQTGGTVPGDRAHNALFRHPGTTHHWIALCLQGKPSNRRGLGARVTATLKGGRQLHRVVGAGSSFGGNSQLLTLGLGDAQGLESVAISWPGDRSRQTFRNLTMDKTWVVTEGDATPQLRSLDRQPHSP